MAPHQSRRSGQSSSPDEAEEDAEAQTSYDSFDLLKTAQNLVSKSKKLRDAERKVIEAEHEQKTKEVLTKITTLFESRKYRVTKAQKAKWDRLEALNKKRYSLEAEILKCMKSIEQHSANIANEMGAMFGGRIEEIQESSVDQAAK